MGLCLGAMLVAPSNTAKTKLVSHWLDREIAVDGEIDEWRDTLVYINSVDAFVAVFNDESALYLCLYLQDPKTANQFAMDGLRLRIEAKDAGEFAVHFPKGTGRPDPRDRRDAGVDSAPPGGDVIELELPGQRDRVAVTSGGEAGIEARVSLRGSFVYELKIPLVQESTHPWALGLFPGDTFKLVIENPQIDTLADDQAARRRPRDNSSPYDQGPFGSRRDPGWTGGGGPQEPFSNNRFVFVLKARVELARAPKR